MKTRSSLVLLTALILSINSCSTKEKEYLNLSGQWQFKMDSLDVGVKEAWYNQEFQETIQLPGSMKDAGYGYAPALKTEWTGSIYDSSWYYNPELGKYRDGDTLYFPFWLTPDKHYLGAAWYKRSFNLPVNWEDKKISLALERPHWESTVWLNGKEVANQNSLSVPHLCDLSPFLQNGNNELCIRIDNRMDEVNVGPDSHSVSDHTQGNWNGIIGDIHIQANEEIRIAHVDIYPDLEKKQVKTVLFIKNESAIAGIAELELQAKSKNPARKHSSKTIKHQFELHKTGDTLSLILPMGNNFLTWDEFEPNLYQLEASLTTDKTQSSRQAVFGMREIKVKGKQILLNGNPIYLRGNVDCCVFPLTGYPSMEVTDWKQIYQRLKSFGLNHVRFHSWCPPKAAFEAADEVGIYLQPEGPSWPNHGTSLGNGRAIDKYILEESERIIQEYGNHASFLMFASGNEPRGNYVAFLDEFLKYWKTKDKRRIYTGASIGGSWKACPENEFHVKGGARGLPWKRLPNSEFDYAKNIAAFDEPFITHELGQYCVFPDFSEIEKYTGTYSANNFKLFRDLLEKNHMADQAEDFLLASGELQKRCYKYEMEANLRTEGMSGYQLLGINDFPGQGTALVGVMNAFYEAKSYAQAEYFRQFCAPLTITAALPKFVWKNNETFSAELQLANYSADAIDNTVLEWSIKNQYGELIAASNVESGELKIGSIKVFPKISLDLIDINAPGKYTLNATTKDIQNTWDFWVFPESLPEYSGEIHICDTLDKNARKVLSSGGKVLLLAAGKVENGKDVVQYFRPVFWNTSWFKMRPPHTTGLLIKDEHPVFQNFPTSFHSDMQWFELTNRQQLMNLENFPPEFRPIVQAIDTWFISRRLGMLWEAKSNGGRIMVCSADLSSDPENRPAARQLLHSILQYMDSNDFEPENDIALNVIDELFEVKERNIIHMYTKDSPDELKPKH